MDTAIDDLLIKVKVIAQGPDSDLLRKLVNILYDRQVEHDLEPLSPEEAAMVQKGLEALHRGDKTQFISLEEYEKERGAGSMPLI